MRLITHNLLACHAARPSAPCVAPNNFPLAFQDVTRIEIVETELNTEFLRGMMHKIDYNALLQASRQLGDDSLPDKVPDIGFDQGENTEEQEENLAKLHRVLLELQVQDGAMVCPSCGHIYPIRDGIPNMLLAEHEIKR